MTGPLDGKRIRKLFDELSDELKWTRTRAQIYIVGGAAIYTGLFPEEPLKTRARQILQGILPPPATAQSEH